MRLGVVFPQSEIGDDPGAICDLAQAAEAIGYDHLLIYERQLGVNRDVWADFQSPYPLNAPFHEPFVLLAYMAALTRTLEFATNVLVLPQRQTVLAAKQVAELDILSDGRFRLGLGVGANPSVYQLLGLDYHTRGAYCEEQVDLLRALWIQDEVRFSGRWHEVTGAGISPRPRRPIPIWFGGGDDRVLRRTARIGDGWFPLGEPDAAAAASVKRLRDYVAEAGRDPASIGVEPMVHVAGKGPGEVAQAVAAWSALGATHVSINTMGAGLQAAKHIDLWREAYQRLREVGDRSGQG